MKEDTLNKEKGQGKRMEKVIDIGDTVTIVDQMKQYTKYDKWVIDNAPEYLSLWIANGDLREDVDDEYIVRGKADHGSYYKVMLYLVQNMRTKQVYVIGEEGIEVCKKADIPLAANDEIDVRFEGIL